jgi:hypothetical protein
VYKGFNIIVWSKPANSFAAILRNLKHVNSTLIVIALATMRILHLATLASLASAASVDISKRESPLYVKLEMASNTAVKAYIINTGSTALKLFKIGSLLDDNPVEKVEVFQGGT